MIELLVDSGIEYSYQDLLESINEITEIDSVVNESDLFLLFVKYVAAIVHGVDTTVIDSDLSETEQRSIGVSSVRLRRDGEPVVETFSDLMSILERRKSTWKLTLFTSGTTGRPKSVTHTLEKLTRMVRTGPKYERNVWGFAYNPTHFAGFQVFFQALYNCNTMVRLFGRPIDSVVEDIRKYGVTHISATPTFVRGLIRYLATTNEKLETVRRLTTGGERFDPSIVDKISVLLPNARLNNIYASTEAGSLFVGHGDTLVIPQNLRGLISFSNSNEILIHGDLLGYGEGLLLDENGWYNTGDIVDEPDPDGFRILGRRSDFINVGGYKVNPHEVEEVVRIIDGVSDVLCYGISNPVTGKIVAIDVVSDGSIEGPELERSVERTCEEELQAFKRPRIINVVKSLDQTRTGKLTRR